MNIRKHALFPLAVGIVALPSLSWADMEGYPQYGELGYLHVAHVSTSAKTRQEVVADVAVGRKDGSMWLSLRGVPTPVKSTAPGKTREQVLDETRNETVSERHARMFQ